MGQQSRNNGGLGQAHPVPYSPEPETKSEEKEDDFPQSLEEALTG